MGLGHSPRIATDGLVFCVDAANQKSFSSNVFPGALDIYSWYFTRKGDNIGNNCTVSQDGTTAKSPAGGIPMLMDVTGSDSYISSAGTSAFNICPALDGQTWTISVWIKSAANSTAQLYVFNINSSGTGLETFVKSVNVTTQWRRVELTATFNNVATVNFRIRLDGSNTSGDKIWWDGLQVELAAAATRFNPRVNANRSNISDLVNNTNNGTLTNYPGYSEDVGGSLVFDGVDDVIDCGTSDTLNFTANHTIDVWCNPVTHGGGDLGRFVERGNYIYYLENRLGENGVKANINGTPGTTVENCVTLNAWQNFVIVNKQTTADVYKNGKFVGTITGLTAVTGSSNPFLIGNRSDLARTFNGKFGTVRAYNRALSAAEIQQNFNALRGRFGI